MMELKVATPISTEPVSLEEAKLHLRVDYSADDSLIESLITTAREYCESHTRRALAAQTWDMFLDDFPSEDYIEIPMPPLSSVTHVKYKDCNGTLTTLTASTDYLVDTDSDPGRIWLAYNKSWPVFTPYPCNPLQIRFVAGYASAPASIKHAILLLVGHLYENREATSDRTISVVPLTVDALLSSYRVYDF